MSAKTKEPAKEWTLDADARVRIDLGLAEITAKHARDFPTCSLCGRVTRVLDKFGLCPVQSPKGEHEDWRAEARAQERAAPPARESGVRFR